MPRVKEPTKQEQKAEEAERKLHAAVGNTNQEQIDRRNAIADRADEFRAPELQDVDGEKIIERDPEEARAEAEAQATEVERARLEAEASEAEARRLQEESTPPPRMHTLRINGRDVQLPEDEVLRLASKNGAAENLELAKRAYEAVQRNQAPAPSQDVSASVSGADIEATLTSALQGDQEAIRKVAQALAAAQQLPQTVDGRLAFHDAVNWFRGEYKDVVNDPFLYQLVVDQDKRIAESEPALPYRERLKKAGDTIRNWKQGFTKTSDTNPKLARKAATAPVPAAGSRQSVREDEEAEEPVESVIDAIAKSRGQVQAIRTPQGMFGTTKS